MISIFVFLKRRLVNRESELISIGQFEPVDKIDLFAFANNEWVKAKANNFACRVSNGGIKEHDLPIWLYPLWNNKSVDFI